MDEVHAPAVFLQDRRAPNPYRRPFLILVVVICLSLMAQAFSSWQTWNVAHSTNTIVKDVRFKNSPEAQKRQDDQLKDVIRQFDCNTRKAIEDALNQLASRNPQSQTGVDITETACRD